MPPIAPAITMNHGGNFQNTNIPNKTTASAKSKGEIIAETQSGLYKAARRMPTTTALMAVKAPWTLEFLRNILQNGRTPIMRRKPGKKIEMIVSIAPGIP